MRIIIQKFGGTSLGDNIKRAKAIEKIEAGLKKGFRPVVVVSAMGRKGDPYATDSLVNLVKSMDIEASPRDLDLLMSCGEIISAVVMANDIRLRGYETEVFTGGQAGILTDDNFLDAKILHIDPKKIMDSIEKGYIPIICGFQGVDEGGHITTLGRGGSDVTASIMGEALGAEMVEIYTDVNGVMTADPKIVPEAQVMDTIFYNEVFQMTEYGAKVLHPRAVEIAMRSNIPIIIRNTNTEDKGTLITSYDRKRSYREEDHRLVTSVTSINNRTQVRILTSDLNYQYNEVLFDKIAGAGVSIDMINIYPDQIFFIIDQDEKRKLEKVLGDLGCDYSMVENCSKVTIIGNGMRGRPGVMAKTVAALAGENIEILQTSDSHTTISCLIEDINTSRAVNGLHKYFGLERGIE